MKRLHFGDLIEFRTARGLAYAQYTHKNKMYGYLIRLIDGFFDSRPTNLVEVAEGKTKFVTFFPLGAAVSRGIVVVAGNQPIPEDSQRFPIFRSGTADRDTNVDATWWLWDGEKEWRVGVSEPHQWKFPILGIWNDTLLIERLESDWKLEESSW